MRKFKNGYETSTQGLGKIAPATRRPPVLREPIGIASVDEPGRRSSNQQAFLEYHAGAEFFTAGSFIHGSELDLQRTNVPVDTALLCAKSAGSAWRLGVNARASSDGRYTRGGPDAPFPCAMAHDDALALRTFEFRMDEHHTNVLVVQRKAGWEARPLDGWRIVGGTYPYFTLER